MDIRSEGQETGIGDKKPVVMGYKSPTTKSMRSHECRQMLKAYGGASYIVYRTVDSLDKVYNCWLMGDSEYEMWPIVSCPFCGKALKKPDDGWEILAELKHYPCSSEYEWICNICNKAIASLEFSSSYDYDYAVDHFWSKHMIAPVYAGFGWIGRPKNIGWAV